MQCQGAIVGCFMRSELKQHLTYPRLLIFKLGILFGNRLSLGGDQSADASSGLRARTSPGEAIARLVSLPVIR